MLKTVEGHHLGKRAEHNKASGPRRPSRARPQVRAENMGHNGREAWHMGTRHQLPPPAHY